MPDLPISGLPAAGALTGAELTVVNQGGTSVQLDLDELADYVSGWVRPADWPAMPADASNKVCILTAVYDNGSNYASFNCVVSSGTYNIDWGDGTSDIGVTSGTAIHHLYSYADVDLGPVTSRGYKTAMVVVTPNTGGANFTTLNFGVKHTASGLQNYSPLWLDAQINAPSCTSLLLRDTLVPLELERIKINAIGNLTSLSMQGFRGLQVVNFPSGSLTGLTSIANLFRECSALQYVEFPSGSLQSVTSAQEAFRDCSALKGVGWPSAGLAACTNFSSVFVSCKALIEIANPVMPLCTNISACFNSCNALQRSSWPDLGNVTTIATLYDGCGALAEITFPTGSFGSLATVTNAFQGCQSLGRIQNCAIPVSFTVASCKLSGTALDEIYTALPSVSATITVTNNVGTASDTPSIATSKGWVVTG